MAMNLSTDKTEAHSGRARVKAPGRTGPSTGWRETQDTGRRPGQVVSSVESFCLKSTLGSPRAWHYPAALSAIRVSPYSLHFRSATTVICVIIVELFCRTVLAVSSAIQ